MAAWLALGGAAFVAGAVAFVASGGADPGLRKPRPRLAGRADVTGAILDDPAAALAKQTIAPALGRGRAEEELLAEILRVTAKPAPREVEHILSLRRAGVRDAALEDLTDALLGDDVLVRATVREWLRRQRGRERSDPP